MRPNGKDITQEDLEKLPEVENKVLWQEDDGPIFVTDNLGVTWNIGFYGGILSKIRHMF